jgi:hypothetical protein
MHFSKTLTNFFVNPAPTVSIWGMCSLYLRDMVVRKGMVHLSGGERSEKDYICLSDITIHKLGKK